MSNKNQKESLHLYTIDTKDINEKIEIYSQMIEKNNGVPYIFGAPGLAKTALMATICKRRGWVLEDQRLTQKDSSEVGGIPKAVYDEEVNLEVMKMIIPSYLVKAVKRAKKGKHTLIVYDELPRASQDTRNAAMQIFNERRCDELELPDEVHIVALGNIGIEDGTEGDEFDTAMWGRLIPVEHRLTISEWEEGFAKENVNPFILDFVKTNGSAFYKLPDSSNPEQKSYPSPRSWTFYSTQIGKDSHPRDFLNIAEKIGHCYVGTINSRFIQWCRSRIKINIWDIINNYPKIKKQIALEIQNKDKRGKESMLMNELKTFESPNPKIKTFWDLNKNQQNNIISFLKTVEEDAKVAFLIHLLNQEKTPRNLKGEKLKFFKVFSKDLKSVYEMLEKTKQSKNN